MEACAKGRRRPEEEALELERERLEKMPEPEVEGDSRSSADSVLTDRVPSRIRDPECTPEHTAIFLDLDILQELRQTRWDPPLVRQTRQDPHTPCHQVRLIAWGAVHRHMRRPGQGRIPPRHGRVMQEPQQPGLTARQQLAHHGKGIPELAIAEGLRARLASARCRSRRRRQCDPLRDTTAKAPVHHRMTRGLILQGSRL